MSIQPTVSAIAGFALHFARSADVPDLKRSATSSGSCTFNVDAATLRP